MKVFALTDLGKKIVKNRESSSDGEMKVLQFIRENRTATDSELEVVGGNYLVRGLKRKGLVKELTT